MNQENLNYITIIDSTLASLGYGLLVLEASKLRKKGKTIKIIK